MPANEAARHTLAAALKPILPTDWRIIRYQVNLDALSTVVLMLKQSAIRRLPAAPQGALQIDFTATIASPLLKIENAEDALDDDVVAFTTALDLLGIQWTAATKVLFQEKYFAYDIDLNVSTSKETEND